MIIMVVANTYAEYQDWFKKNFPYLANCVDTTGRDGFNFIPGGYEGYNRACSFVRGTFYIHLSGEIHPQFETRFTKIAVVFNPFIQFKCEVCGKYSDEKPALITVPSEGEDSKTWRACTDCVVRTQEYLSSFCLVKSIGGMSVGEYLNQKSQQCNMNEAKGFGKDKRG